MFKFSPQRIASNVAAWRNYLPSVKPYYAMKCNPHTRVINELSKLNVNFECAALSEINKCLPTNKDIIYGHPHKTIDQIVRAKEIGIKKIVYDSIAQLGDIYKYYPNSLPILRIKSMEDKSKIKFNQKFGASDNEIDEILRFHERNKFKLYGISFHVGSKCYYPEQYNMTIEKIKRIIDNNKLEIKMIDIGGGFPTINYSKTDNKNNFGEIEFKNHAEQIERYISGHECFKKYEFVGEPGRFLVDNALKLEMKVINKREKEEIINNKKEKINTYYVNESVYGSLNGVIFDGREIEYETDRPKYKTILYGQTCDSVDKIDCMLPEFKIGDKIILDNFGAYTWAGASQFNGFPRAKWYNSKEELK